MRDQDVRIGQGCYIGQGAILVTGTVVGDHVNIHTGATIDHDNVIEDGANIGPGYIPLDECGSNKMLFWELVRS
ncbi:MAG: hypothetical protein IPH05_08020 [Flavobacteriales bacterium]|nr:hypothetical protein [Flavobacteriales bacterium]